MVLFCAEAVDWVTSGLFGKPWKKAEYLRTAASAQLPPAARYPARPAGSMPRLCCSAVSLGRSSGGLPL